MGRPGYVGLGEDGFSCSRTIYNHVYPRRNLSCHSTVTQAGSLINETVNCKGSMIDLKSIFFFLSDFAHFCDLIHGCFC